MQMVDLRVPRRRFIVLLLVALACALACHFHIRSVGNRYVMRLEDEFVGKQLSPKDFTVSPEDFVEVTGVQYDGDVPLATLEARKPGEGMLVVNHGEGGMALSVRVDPGNVVVVDGANFTGWRSVGWSFALCFGLAAIICIWNAVWLRRRSWYDYDMVFNVGAGLFCTVQTVEFLQAMLSPRTREFMDLLFTITDISAHFVIISLLPMAIAALFMCISNIQLVRHEGPSPTNLLGIAMSVVWALACFGWFSISRLDWSTYAGLVVIMLLDSVVASLIAYGLALLIGSSLCAWDAARHSPSKPRDYLMILGCGLRPDGTPTPLLAGRVDAARGFAHEQVAEGQAAPTYVPSGGQGSDEACAEAESMRRYLLGFEDDPRIVLEDRSTNTRENFSLSAGIIAQDSSERGISEPRIAFATTNYHVFRGYVYAHEAGMAAEGIASPTKLYFWPNAFLREFMGLLVARAPQIIVSSVLIAAIYAFAEFTLLVR